MRILYFLINSFKKEKPYFTFSKYVESKIKYNEDELPSILLNHLNSEETWVSKIDNKELKQISKSLFKTIDKKYNHIDIDDTWVEWR